MQLKRDLLPHGQHLARLVARSTLGGGVAASADGSVQLGVTITDGSYAGRFMEFRVWGAGRVRRARSLKQGQLVRVYVIRHRLDDGRLVNRVVDFHAADELSVADALESGRLAIEGSLSPTDSSVETPALPNAIWVQLTTAIAGRTPKTRSHETAVSKLLCSPLTANRDQSARDFRLGFHRQGGKGGTRSLVDYETQLRAYASSLRGLEGEAHLSVYQYGPELAAYQEASETKSLAGYRDRSWARWLAFDLDGDGTAASLESLLRGCRELMDAFVALDVPADRLIPFFSGHRGVHLMVPAGSFGAGPKQHFEKAAGRACGTVAQIAGLTIDENLYKPLASLRAPNTRHDKSGLFKIRLSTEELQALTAEELRRLAEQPRGFELPDWRVAPSPLLVDVWSWACSAASVQERQAARVAQVERRIHATTFDLMLHGAAEGERGVRFFKAAMNLLDFGCPEELLIALLEPAARFSDYPAKDFQAQIEGAIKAHGAHVNATT